MSGAAAAARAGDLLVDALGRLLQLLVAGALQQRQRQHDRLHLLDRKHQRRQVEAGAHDVADAAPALDRHPHRLKCGDIAVDRAHRHFQRFGDLRRRHRTAASRRIWMISNSRDALRMGHLFIIGQNAPDRTLSVG
jgi:hypothetical protein